MNENDSSSNLSKEIAKSIISYFEDKSVYLFDFMLIMHHLKLEKMLSHSEHEIIPQNQEIVIFVYLYNYIR